MMTHQRIDATLNDSQATGDDTETNDKLASFLIMGLCRNMEEVGTLGIMRLVCKALASTIMISVQKMVFNLLSHTDRDQLVSGRNTAMKLEASKARLTCLELKSDLDESNSEKKQQMCCDQLDFMMGVLPNVIGPSLTHLRIFLPSPISSASITSCFTSRCQCITHLDVISDWADSELWEALLQIPGVVQLACVLSPHNMPALDATRVHNCLQRIVCTAQSHSDIHSSFSVSAEGFNALLHFAPNLMYVSLDIPHFTIVYTLVDQTVTEFSQLVSYLDNRISLGGLCIQGRTQYHRAQPVLAATTNARINIKIVCEAMSVTPYMLSLLNLHDSVCAKIHSVLISSSVRQSMSYFEVFSRVVELEVDVRDTEAADLIPLHYMTSLRVLRLYGMCKLNPCDIAWVQLLGNGLTKFRAISCTNFCDFGREHVQAICAESQEHSSGSIDALSYMNGHPVCIMLMAMHMIEVGVHVLECSYKRLALAEAALLIMGTDIPTKLSHAAASSSVLNAECRVQYAKLQKSEAYLLIDKHVVSKAEFASMVT